jgi:hypothetical protein
MADHHGRALGRKQAFVTRTGNVVAHDTSVMIHIHAILRSIRSVKDATAAEVARRLTGKVLTSRGGREWHRGQVIRVLGRLGVSADELTSLFWALRPVRVWMSETGGSAASAKRLNLAVKKLARVLAATEGVMRLPSPRVRHVIIPKVHGLFRAVHGFVRKKSTTG